MEPVNPTGVNELLSIIHDTCYFIGFKIHTDLIYFELCVSAHANTQAHCKKITGNSVNENQVTGKKSN